MFDPHHKWLGIPKGQRPPTHYQLLGVDPTEQDADVIEEAAIRQTTHVRAYQIGPHAAECTQLLNEIAQARQTLLNPAKRKAYDDKIAAPKQRAEASDAAAAITAQAPAPNVFADVTDGPPLLRRSRELHSASIRRSGANWLLALGIGGGVIALALVGVVVVLFLRSPAAPIVEGPKPKPAVKPEDEPEVPPVKPIDQQPVVPDQPPPIIPVKAPPKELVAELEQHTIRKHALGEGVKSMLWTRHPNQVILGGDQVKVFDVVTGKIVQTFGEAKDERRLALAVSRDGQTIYTLREFGSVDAWDRASGKKLRTLTQNPSRAFLAISPDSRLLYFGRPDRLVSIWDLPSNKELATLDPQEPQNETRLGAMAISPDGQRLLCSHDAKVSLWNTETRERNGTHDSTAPFAVAFHPSGGIVLAMKQKLNVFNRELSYLRQIDAGYRDVQFTPDGKYLVCRTHEPRKQLVVLRWPGLKAVRSYGDDFEAFAVAPDSRSIAAHHRDGSVYHLTLPGADAAVIVKNPDPMPEVKKVPEVKPAPSVTRLPVPAESDRQAADKLMRERFAKELAKTGLPDHAALAEKLLKTAEENKDNAADRYVLLAEALQQAVAAAKPNLAAKAVDEMTSGYDIDAVKMKLSTYAALNTALGKLAQAKFGSKELGDLALAAAREAGQAEDFPLALQYIAEAKTAATKAQSAKYVADMQKQEANLQATAKDFQSMQAAQKVLETDAEKEAAHGAVGKYLCLRRGEWSRGLPNLAKGGDNVLSALARQELKNPSEHKEQADLGEAWFAAADKEPETTKSAFQHRALYWFRQALPQATGQLKGKITDRIAALEAVPAPFAPKELLAEVRRVKAHTAPITSFELSPDGKRIFTGGLDGLVKGWEVTNLRQAFTWASKIPVHSFSIAPDGGHIAICSDAKVQLWDLLKATAKPRRDMGSVPGAFWLDGESLYRVQNVTFWSHMVTKGGGGGQKVPSTTVNRTVASPDRKVVAMLAVGEVLMVRMGDRGPMGQVKSFCQVDAVAAAFSPDNLLLALAEKDGNIRIFDVNTQLELKTLAGHKGTARAMAFVSATRLLSGGDDKSLRLWDAVAGKEIVRVTCASPITAVAVSADGRQAFTAGGDLTLRQWDLPPESK